MKYDDFDEEYEDPEIVNGFRLFMLPQDVARAVICPNSVLVIIDANDMIAAFNDLHTWGLTIHPKNLNQ